MTSCMLIDDDDDDWIPLESPTQPLQESIVQHAAISSRNIRDTLCDSKLNRSESSSLSNLLVSKNFRRRGQKPPTALVNGMDDESRRKSMSRQKKSLQSIKHRLETNTKLKKALVDHPLKLFFGRSVIHFACDVWQDLELRSGIFLVLTGSILQTIWFLCYSLQFWLNPRVIFLLFILILSCVYSFPTINIEKLIENTTPTKIIDTSILVLSHAHFRMTLIIMLLIPTVLEAKLMTFLSSSVVESGIVNNVMITTFILCWMLLQKKVGLKPRDCTLQGIIILYIAALVLCAIRVDVRRTHTLIGPFLLATGSLLIIRSNDDTRLSRLVRHALRLTLRDVFLNLGNSVREDEMLQLAMLRWLVDYWTCSPSPPPPCRATTCDASDLRAATDTNSLAPTLQRTVSDCTTTRAGSTLASTAPDRNPHLYKDDRSEMQWDELYSMLMMTTDQMSAEVHSPQATAQGTKAEVSSNDSNTNASMSRSTNESLENLKAMLMSMDVDEHAKPAVMAYKRAIESFPPSRSVAECIAIAKRVPATISLSCLYLLGSPHALPATFTLLPFIAFEVFRVRLWAKLCERAFVKSFANGSNEIMSPPAQRPGVSSVVNLPEDMNAMTIILSEDNHTTFNPSALLQVWGNVEASVSALEHSLTISRVIQTTVVATDFAKNIISLAHFGFEVSNKGWVHGISILVKEFIHIHSSATTEGSISITGGDQKNPTRYTSSAVDALKNSKIVARNVGVLMDHNDHGPIDFLTILIGRGWLWGKSGSPTSSAAEAPEVERVDDTEKESSKQQDMSLSTGNADQNECIDGKEQDTDAMSAQSKVLDTANVTVTSSIKRTSTSEKDMQDVLEDIANAFERELITEDEKNSFIEMLLIVREDNNDGSFLAEIPSINKIRSSLRCLAEESEINAEHRPQMQEDQVLGGKNSNRLIEHDTRHNTSNDDVHSSIDSKQTSSFDSSSRNTAEVEPLSSRSGDNTISKASAEVPLQTHNTKEEEEENHHWVQWLGGGIVAAGAVVGGLAMASARHNNGENTNDNLSSQQTREEDKRATPYIEEIVDNDDDEKETDSDWEPVSQGQA